ncbi:MAG: sulfurtransferase TusA family protein [Candidatus Odinarchaeota archaeon]
MSVENSIDQEIKIKKKIDIKGQICPMTFVYTKLALEELNKDDVLVVELDFSPAIKNIPANCERQSLAKLIEIREINRNAEIYELVLKKI